MKIVAQKRGAFLIEVGEGLGRIYDPDLQRIYSPFPIQEILETGEWTEPKGDVPDIQKLIAEGKVNEVEIAQRAKLGEGTVRDEIRAPMPR